MSSTAPAAATTHRKIACPDYDPLPGERTCRYFRKGGACGLPTGFMCTEWLAVNGDALPPPAPPKGAGPRTLNQIQAAALEASGASFCVETDSFGPLWLVPTYTGAARAELSFEHLAAINTQLAAVPGARFVAFHRERQPGED